MGQQHSPPSLPTLRTILSPTQHRRKPGLTKVLTTKINNKFKHRLDNLNHNLNYKERSSIWRNFGFVPDTTISIHKNAQYIKKLLHLNHINNHSSVSSVS